MNTLIKKLAGACVLATVVLGVHAATLVAAPASPPASVPEPAAAPVPAGNYTLDKSHATLLFRVNHLGFSHYTARFKQFDATLQFDPANLGAASVQVSVDARSIETDYPDRAHLDFNATLQNEQWLNAKQFPQMTFRSLKATPTGANTLRVDGQLTLRGITHPQVLEVTYNGGYAGHPMDPHARIGFSAHGSLNRSDFGINFGIPSPGSNMGVSDAVEIIIEAEFNGPPLPAASVAAH